MRGRAVKQDSRFIYALNILQTIKLLRLENNECFMLIGFFGIHTGPSKILIDPTFLSAI